MLRTSRLLPLVPLSGSLRRRLLAAAGLAAITALLPVSGRAADEVVLESGRAVSGTIKFEDDNRVEIETTEYGTLKFQKHRIKEIRREGAAPAARASGGASGASPFSSAAPAAASSGNPFDTGMPASTPAAGTNSSNPFAPISEPGEPGGKDPAGEAQAFLVPSTPVDPASYNLPESVLPDSAIPAGADGVIYGFDDAMVVEVKKSAGAEWVRVTAGAGLMAGNEVRVGEGRALLRLRGRDTIRLQPRSQVAVREIGTDGLSLTLDLRIGGMWVATATRTRPVKFRIIAPDLIANMSGGVARFTVVTGSGTRVACFAGEVPLQGSKTNATATATSPNSILVNMVGQLEAPTPVTREELEEWSNWTTLSLDVAKSNLRIGMRPVSLSGEENIAKSQDAISAVALGQLGGAERTIQTSKFTQILQGYRDAFLAFARDTGHVPDDTKESWQVLRENRGNWEGWNGPYLQDVSLPPLDPWRRPIHYSVRAASGGKIHAIVYSEGVNQTDDKGRAGTDDIVEYAQYYQLPKVHNNPKYKLELSPRAK